MSKKIIAKAELIQGNGGKHKLSAEYGHILVVGRCFECFFTKIRVKCNFLFANILVLRFFLQIWCDKLVTNIKNTHKSAMKDGQKSL